MKTIIRNETPADYRSVENLTRESFWNVYKPGADEHYFVHQMRSHPDFIRELAFVLECDSEIVGNIMYIPRLQGLGELYLRRGNFTA